MFCSPGENGLANAVAPDYDYDATASLKAWLQDMLDQHLLQVSEQLQGHKMAFDQLLKAQKEAAEQLQNLSMHLSNTGKTAASPTVTLEFISDKSEPVPSVAQAEVVNMEAGECKTEASSAQEMEKRPALHRASTGNMTATLAKLSEAVAENSEPEQTLMGKLRKFVTERLDVYTGAAVVLNIVAMIVETQWFGTLADASLGEAQSNLWGPGTKDAVQGIETVFVCIYVLDLCLRLIVLGGAFFYDYLYGIQWFNMFDGVVTLVNCVDVVMTFIEEETGTSNAAFARFVKLLRLFRILRIARTIKLFTPLRILVVTCIASLGSLFWSMVLLFMCKITCALVMSQSLHSYIVDTSNDLDMRKWSNRYYGSFIKSVYTLFEVTHSGGWPQYVRPLVEGVDPWYAIVFISYITIVVFAIIRIITALFLKETLDSAASDALMQIEQKKQQGQQYRKKLCEVFENVDESGDGVLTRDEIEQSLSNPILRKYLSVLGVDVHEVGVLFDLIDTDGSGNITAPEFCEGLVRMRGQARAIDVITLLHENRRLMRKCEKIEMFCELSSKGST